MVDLDGEQYLTGEEAASLLGIKRETLYAYVSRGYLKSYRQRRCLLSTHQAQVAQQLSRFTSFVKEMATSLSASAIVG